MKIVDRIGGNENRSLIEGSSLAWLKVLHGGHVHKILLSANEKERKDGHAHTELACVRMDLQKRHES